MRAQSYPPRANPDLNLDLEVGAMIALTESHAAVGATRKESSSASMEVGALTRNSAQVVNVCHYELTADSVCGLCMEDKTPGTDRLATALIPHRMVTE